MMVVTFLFWLLLQGTFSLIVEAYHDSTMRGPEKGQYIAAASHAMRVNDVTNNCFALWLERWLLCQRKVKILWGICCVMRNHAAAVTKTLPCMHEVTTHVQ